MIKYEYQFLPLFQKWESLEKRIEELGDQGYEYKGVKPGNPEMVVMQKRVNVPSPELSDAEVERILRMGKEPPVVYQEVLAAREEELAREATQGDQAGVEHHKMIQRVDDLGTVFVWEPMPGEMPPVTLSLDKSGEEWDFSPDESKGGL